MELEHAVAIEMSRLDVIAGEASREIAANRPWWIHAVAFLAKVVL